MVRKDIEDIFYDEKRMKIREMYKKAINGISLKFKIYPECWDYLQSKYPQQYEVEVELDKKAHDACNKWKNKEGDFIQFRDALKEWYMFWMEYLKLYNNIKNDGRRT